MNIRSGQSVRQKGEDMKLCRYEQETIINYNAGEKTATVYTRDPAVMRRIDALVIDICFTYALEGVRILDN